MGVIVRRENLDRVMRPGRVMLRNREDSQKETKRSYLDQNPPSAHQRNQPWIEIPAPGSVTQISAVSWCIP